MTSPALIRARWYDGRSSQAQPVMVVLVPGPRGPGLRLQPLNANTAVQEFAHPQVTWPEVWGNAPRKGPLVADLQGAGSLEIDDHAAWQHALAAAGNRPALAQRMQTQWPVLLGVLAVAAVALWAFYRWGTPWAATQLTRHVPVAWEAALTEQALKQIDTTELKPSQLPPERQAALRQGFEALATKVDPALRRYPGYTPPLTLLFRSGMDANAFALPGGTVVMTDGLAEAAAKAGLPDDALLGVLAHELGHVMHRHTTRMLVEQGVLNVGLGLALGDVSSVVSMGTSLLTGLAYRRNHETEADCFALALMQRAQLPTAPMGTLLLAIESAQHGGKDANKEADQAPDAAAGKPAEKGAWEWLSSHPDTRQRALRLQQGQASGC